MPGKAANTSTNFFIGSGSIGVETVYGFESGLVLVKFQLNGAQRPVAVLGNDYFRGALLFGRRIYFFAVFSVQEHNDVGILLYGARIAEVGKARHLAFSLFYLAGELGNGDDRHVYFSRQPLDLA